MPGFFDFFTGAGLRNRGKPGAPSAPTAKPAPNHGTRYPDLKSRRSRGTAASPQIQPPNVIGADYIADFLAGEYTTVVSSNVQAAQYHPEDRKLMVEFIKKKGKGGGAYLYSDVSPAEAHSFITAASHGGWCWDHLRVRGSKTAHQKSFVKLR